MENVSKFLGKPVVSIFNGNFEGYVKNVLVNKKLEKICYIEIFDDITSEEKILDVKDIHNFKNDAIMLKNSENIYIKNTIETNCVNPIGFNIFTVTGNDIGKIANLTFDNKFNIVEIILKNEKILHKQDILTVGENIVIKKDNAKIKLSNFKPKTEIQTKTNLNQLVEIMSQNEVPVTKTHPNKILLPSYEFLIGRKVGQNIYADNGQILIKKHGKITAQIIDIASKNGKLKELTTFSV